MTTRALTIADHHSTITLHPGDQFQLSLEENPTTGFRWAVVEDAGARVSIVQDRYIPATPATPGAAGHRHLTFTATESGQARLILRYRQEWDRASASSEFSIHLHIL